MLTRIKWDLYSPRFQEASLSLGYTEDDLTLKTSDYFKSDDRKIMKVRYQHHLIKLKQMLNEVIEARLQIITNKQRERNEKKFQRKVEVNLNDGASERTSNLGKVSSMHTRYSKSQFQLDKVQLPKQEKVIHTERAHSRPLQTTQRLDIK